MKPELARSEMPPDGAHACWLAKAGSTVHLVDLPRRLEGEPALLGISAPLAAASRKA